MKIRFSIQKLFLLTLVFGLILCFVVYVQNRRQQGSDTLQRTLSSLGSHLSYLHSGIVDLSLNPDPTLQDRFWGNTALVDASPEFEATEIGAAVARLLSQSRAGQEIGQVTFRKTVLSDAEYFPGHWEAVKCLSFIDVNLPPEWKVGLRDRSQHIERMLFAGNAINLSVADFQELKNLKVLVLSNLDLDRSEIEKIKAALPSTKVVVTADVGERGKFEVAPKVDFFSGSKIVRYRKRFQELEKRIAKSGLPRGFFKAEQCLSDDQLAQFEAQVGISFHNSLRAFLLARNQRLFCDPIFEKLTQRLPCVVTFQSNGATSFSETFAHVNLSEFGENAEYFSALQIGEYDGLPLWVGLENGILLIGEKSQVVRCAREDLDAHLNYYFEVLMQYQRSKKESSNGFDLPSYISVPQIKKPQKRLR